MKLILIMCLIAINVSKVLQHEININLFMRFYTFFFNTKSSKSSFVMPFWHISVHTNHISNAPQPPVVGDYCLKQILKELDNSDPIFFCGDNVGKTVHHVFPCYF